MNKAQCRTDPDNNDDEDDLALVLVGAQRKAAGITRDAEQNQQWIEKEPADYRRPSNANSFPQPN